MNPDTKLLLENLSNELYWLHAKWNIYLQLYGTEPEDLELINEMSPHFFRIIQDTLIDEILLGLCRLMDPIKTHSRKEIRENLSFKYLIDKINTSINSEAKIALENLLNQLDLKTDEMRTQRNRRITHFDLLTKAKVDEIPNVTRDMVEDVLRLSSQLLNTVAQLQGGTQKEYEHYGFSDSGETIIRYLRKAKAYDVHCRNGDVDPYEDGVYKNNNAT